MLISLEQLYNCIILLTKIKPKIYMVWFIGNIEFIYAFSSMLLHKLTHIVYMGVTV